MSIPPGDEWPARAQPNAGGTGQADAHVPRTLRYAAGYSWRLLLVGAALVALALALSKLRLVVLPVVVALFATSLLRPPARWLQARGWPDALAAIGVLSGALVALGSVLAVVVPRFVDQFGALGRQLRQGVEDVAEWLLEGPANLSARELDEYLDRTVAQLGQRGDVVVSGLFSSALLAVEIVVGLVLALVLAFFFLRDGERIWDWIVGLFPEAARGDVEEMGARCWGTLAGYLRGVTVVALFDAVFIGLALVVVGVPAALPLAVLTFFGAYIPVAGAVLTGLAAVLVALVSKGLVAAAVIAGAVIVVQQVESNVLHPVVVGRAVSLHPAATLLSVTAGAVLAGVIGAIIAVPLVAVGHRVASYLRDAERATTGADAGPTELPAAAR